MKVSSQRLPESQVLLEVEVDPEQMERSMDRAYRRLVQRYEVPGFRKGKTPRHMLERHLGRARFVNEAIDLLIPEVYNQALEDQDVDAIDQPRIELVSDEPLSFKATVPVRPTLELGEYRKLRIERDEVRVDDGEVDASQEELRHRYALHEPVERPVQTGDIVRADVRIVVEGREVYKEDDTEFRLREGATVLLPGFAEGMVGVEKGQTREIPVSVPEGQRELSGKTGTATVTVKEIKEEKLPELNDEFAREVGEGFTSLDALRERLSNDIRERLEAQAEEEYRDKAVTALVDAAEKIEFPPVLIDREIERLMRDQARQAGQDLERYLEMLKRSAEELQEELRPAATERVRRSLALTKLADEEQIKVQPAEVDEEIEKIVSSSGRQAQQMRGLFSTADARSAIERSILTRKTLDRLSEIAGGGSAEAEPRKTTEKTKTAGKKKVPAGTKEAT
ncbi:MAG: trigger factor [Chloroflexi bacterium]|nr:MAG: trigger factor [Chloroflexota bacterium]